MSTKVTVSKNDSFDIKVFHTLDKFTTVAWCEGMDKPDLSRDALEVKDFSVKVKKLNFADRNKLVKKLMENNNNLDKFVAAKISACVISWDIIGEDGNVLPITSESLAEFDPDITTAILDAISKVNTGI